MSNLGRFVFAFLLAIGTVGNAAAQWAEGEGVTVGSGVSLVINTPQPDIVCLTNNGMLTFASGGSVTITGNAVSAIGTDGAMGVMTVEGGAQVSRTSTSAFFVGLQGGTGTLTVASSGVFDLNDGTLVVAGNNSTTERDPDTRGTLNVGGYIRAWSLAMTAFFPNEPEEPYVDSGEITLSSGGVLEVWRIEKNDRSCSSIYLNGGTIKARASGAFHAVAWGGFLYYVVDNGSEFCFDTAGYDVAFNRADANSFLSISGGGGLRKRGAGRLEFQLTDTNNTFTGNIVVEQGVLNLGRPLAPGQTVTVWQDASFVVYAPSDVLNVTYLGTDKLLYTVGTDTDALDLTALDSTFYADRLGGPFWGTTTLSGALTYDALAGTALNPFRLITQGGTLCLTNTGLENAFIQIEGNNTVAFMGPRLFTPADEGKISVTGSGEYQQQGLFTMAGTLGVPAQFTLEAPARFSTVGGGNALEVGVGGDAVFVASNATVNVERLRIAGTPGAVGEFRQDGGRVVSAQEAWIGYDSGTGTLHVANGEFRVNANLYLAGGFGDTAGRTYLPHGIVNATNATVYANVLNFTPWFPYSAPTVNEIADDLHGEVNLYADSLMDIATITKNDSATSAIFFDGGTLRFRNAGDLINIVANARLRFSAAAESYIAIDIPGAHSWFGGNMPGRVSFTGAGGLKKLGNGVFSFFGHQVDYLGDTVVEAGTLRLERANVLPSGVGFGNLVMQTGTTFDLFGYDATLNRIEGAGTVVNNSESMATLSLLADGSDGHWTRGVVGPIALKKLGIGTMTLAGYDLAPNGLTVAEGTVRIVPSEGYSFYRFKVEGTRDVNCNMMQLCELRFFDGDVNVVPFRTNVFWDSTYSDTHLTDMFTYPGGEQPPSVFNGNLPDAREHTVQGSGNKWLDYRMNPARSPEDRDRVWVRIDFPGTQKITHYNWATANDSPDRDPSAWRLQGSYTGDDWVDLHEVSNYPTTTWRFKWVSDEKFAIDPSNISGRTIAPDADVTVAGGAKLVLDGVPETIGSLSGSGTVTLNDGTLAIAPESGSHHLFIGALQGTGTVIKAGAGTQVFSGASTLDGDFIVQEGIAEINVSSFDWFRLSIKENRSNVDVLQFGEFALYDTDGVRANIGLTEGTGVTTLNPGEFATPENYAVGDGTNERPEKLFDGNPSTKWCPKDNTPNLNDPNSWRTVVLRLPAGSSDIAAYNIATANDEPSRDPITWTLECSTGGEDWVLFDAQTRFLPVTNRFVWYNDDVPFPIGYRALPAAGESFISSASVVEVKDGATLSIVGGVAPISALRVDMVAGAGTITRFTPTADGALYLTNTSGAPGSWTIPITFGIVDNPSNLSKWSIYADGKLLNGYRLSFDSRTSTLRVVAQGTILMLR